MCRALGLILPSVCQESLLPGRRSVIFHANVNTSQALLKWVQGPQSWRTRDHPTQTPTAEAVVANILET